MNSQSSAESSRMPLNVSASPLSKGRVRLHLWVLTNARKQAQVHCLASGSTSHGNGGDRLAAMIGHRLAAMIGHGMVRKLICSFPRSADPRVFTESYLAGRIEL